MYIHCVTVKTGWCVVQWEDATSVARTIGLDRRVCLRYARRPFRLSACLNTLEMFTGDSHFYNPPHQSDPAAN
jgi:hypothetical protein